MDIPPTGRRVTSTGLLLGRRTADGKALDHPSTSDNLVLMQQPGVIPP